MKLINYWTALGVAVATVAAVSVATAQTICGEPKTVNLMAGQHSDAGDITVASDGTYLFVMYTTTDGWKLTETHLAVGATVADIPQTKSGSPKNGQFAYSSTHNGVTTYVYAVPLASVGATEGSTVTIAAHAVVTQEGPTTTKRTETAWGEGTQFEGKNWAMYFEYTIPTCKPEYD